MEWFRNWSLKTKLIAALVFIGLIPTFLFGFLTWKLGSSELSSIVHAELSITRETKAARITGWFTSIDRQIREQAANEAITGALYAFSDAFQRIGKNDASKSVEALQQLYIYNNPHPVGQKDILNDAGDGSYYSEMHARFHPWLREFQRSLEYYDLFLVDMQGNVVYTVFKEVDYATNLENGPYRDTGLAEAFRKVRESSETLVYLSDFQPYAPSNGDAASFIGAPIIDAGTKVGVLLYQMPLNRINEILHERTSAGESGETYLIGSDGLMRSDSQTSPEQLSLKASFRNKEKPPVPEEIVKLAVAGESGNYVGNGIAFSEVLAYYKPVDVLNQRWVLVSERDTEAAFSALRLLGWLILGIVASSALLLAAAAVAVAFFIGKPILAVLADVKRATKHFLSISDQLSESSQQMADGASQQASALEQTSASLTEISSTAKTNAEASGQASQISAEMAKSTKRGQVELAQIRDSIQRMREAADKSSAIIKTIDEIAFQTQLLSLNAAVEAARAGNIGLGFAVVADEVRNLATRSTTAARETEELISNSREAAHQSVDNLRKYAGVLEEISGKSTRITELVTEIAAATVEQAEGTEQIARGVHQSERVVQSNAASAEELAGSAHEMISEARLMEAAIQRLDRLVNGA